METINLLITLIGFGLLGFIAVYVYMAVKILSKIGKDKNIVIALKSMAQTWANTDNSNKIDKILVKQRILEAQVQGLLNKIQV
jgi:hypothetical protein